MKRILLWGVVLVGGYLVLTNYTGFKTDTGAAGSASVNLVKAFQGR